MQTNKAVMQVVNYYARLAQKTVELLQEKKLQTTCCRFYCIRKNGIIPRNDLLKHN
jgi:hypothetical protein